MKQYVIIGNGIATTGCIEGIRSVNKDSRVLIWCRSYLVKNVQRELGIGF